MSEPKVGEKKRNKKMELLIGVVFLGLVFVYIFGVFWLQEVVFSDHDAFITAALDVTIGMGFLGILLIIIAIKSLLKGEMPPLKVRPIFKIYIPSIVFIAILVLSFDHYLSISPNKITWSPFLSVGKTEVYSWDEVEYVNIAARDGGMRESNGAYFLNFSDGTYIDVWDARGMDRAENIKKIDDFVREKGIARYVNSKPSAKQINREYKEKEERDIINKVFSE
ncbi:hypothetical protein [Fredinandcohnia onubensis]|uniref:hypothetical protein n=1 Tax=Fredinandcohnia onubensis TaxID=1571209 RepID=UPI000C0BD94B|nr:hypothetical protein [Fredinandcohnia onubensis]